MLNELLHYSQEVEHAIDHGLPIVALESTIISHGMPYPENFSTALAVEKIIRDAGAVPATIVLYEGQIHIGIDHSVLDFFSKSTEIIKASRRDIAYMLMRKIPASTTVAATMFCAHLAKLPIFVTGGIGGVHHNVDENFDISADLMTLSSTALTIICSGAKSILDLSKTLEVLETQSVPVVGYRTNEFPAFYTHTSGLPLTHRLDTVEELAQLMHFHRSLQLNHGIVIANPIPKTAEIPEHEINPIIQQAQQEAKHMHGNAITPFLLKRIAELTAGQSLRANMDLIKNNAQLGAELAVIYYKNKNYS